MLIRLDRESAVPVYEQIKDHIRGLIEEGRLKPGHRLPSSRGLAESLGVNRTTVCTAYEELEADGYINSHVGQGTYVISPDEFIGKSAGGQNPKRFLPRFSNRSDILNAYPRRNDPSMETRSEIILFSGLTPEEDLFPVEPFRAALNTVMRERGRELLQYGHAQGYLPLREYISSRLVRYSINAGPDQIVIVNGSQQGIDLILRVLTDPGDRAVVESPTYSGLLPVLLQYECDIATVPVGPTGMDLDLLEESIRKKRPRLVYSMPNFHNPTGATLNLEERKRLVDIVTRYETPLVEDDYEKDLRFEGTPIVPVKALDAAGAVIYMGTFSKGLFPGVRIAWIAATQETVERLTAAKRYTDLHTNLLMQAAINEFCRQGHYDAHLRRLHKIYRLRRRKLLDALDREFPSEVCWTRPDGGYALWVSMPEKIDAEELLKASELRGVSFTPGNRFYLDGGGEHSFRLCFSRTDGEQIDEGVAALGALIKERL